MFSYMSDSSTQSLTNKLLIHTEAAVSVCLVGGGLLDRVLNPSNYLLSQDEAGTVRKARQKMFYFLVPDGQQ